ncbi:MAG: hypothetical protein FWD01_02550 [Defluviitaleaceae bacterium]|nr:hypothetical protein [Defluviitaleaceae bacterium]
MAGNFINWFSTELVRQEQIMAIVLGGVFLLALICRIILVGSYNGELSIIKMQLKNIKSKEDIEKMGGGSFARIAKEYIQLGMRGIGKIDTGAIAKLATLRNRIVIFNYQSMGRFVLALEFMILPLGFMLVLVSERPLDFIIVSGGVYVLTKIFASVFDFQMAYERYLATVSHVLNRDIARFFPLDTSSAIKQLSVDIKEMLEKQSIMYGEILGKISGEFSASIRTSTSAMTKSIEITMESIAKHEGLTASIKKWHNLIETAAERQGEIADSMEQIGELSKTVDKYSTSMGSGLEIVGQYQKALSEGLIAYETSLQEITSTLGEAFGKIIDYHMQNAYNSMSGGIADNLKQVSMMNNELLKRLETLFARLEEQGRAQAGILFNIKEQFDDSVSVSNAFSGISRGGEYIE